MVYVSGSSSSGSSNNNEVVVVVIVCVRFSNNRFYVFTRVLHSSIIVGCDGSMAI